jgi:hypothetical protein
MNYFMANLFKDWKYWAKIGFVFIVAMNAVDILSAGFAAPGFFNLWMVKITFVAGFTGLIVYFFYQRRMDKIKRQIEILLPGLMSERRDYFKKMTAADPKFQTFCFDCCHYHAGRRCCSLHLHDREIKIKLNPLDTFSYCLYWNVSDHPIMSLTESLFPKVSEQAETDSI